MTQVLTQLCEALPSFLDGRIILDSMHDRNQKNWKQTEFLAFYIEDFALNFLENFGFETNKYSIKGLGKGNVVIDTFKDFPIDVKTSFKQADCSFNDKFVVDKIIEEFGKIGVIKIVSNGIEDSDFELTKYYKHLKGDFNEISPKTRKVKKGANILGIDYYEILSNSCLKLFLQGKNSNGNPRNVKYLIPKELQPTISIRK